MNKLIAAILGIGLLSFSLVSQGYCQKFQIEASFSGQGIEGPTARYSNDISLYPDLIIAYQMTPKHRIGLTFSLVSGSLSKPRMQGNESGVNITVRSYPIGLEYQYRLLKNAALTPYLQGAFLLIPIRDGSETDTPAGYQTTTSWGTNFGVGADWKLSGRWGMFTGLNYRLVSENSERSAPHIDFTGFNVQLGVKLGL